MCALHQTEKFLSRRRHSLPDLIFISDDQIARGVLTELLAWGVRVPEETQVVTLSNRGFGVLWPTSITRLEMDPKEHGMAVAKASIAFLETGSFSANLLLGSVWKRGKTF